MRARSLSTCARLAAAFAAATSAPMAFAESQPSPSMTRDEATRIVADMRRIVTPRGVERLEPVSIGGIEQWVSIRGNDRDNPVLLMLHGGPGWVSMPSSWYFQRGWEEYFTVVQWDQRGAGKTYAANDPEQVRGTLTLERMVADAEELVAWLRRELGQDKVFLLGHSWGSYLGLQLALRRPEWLHAYIGMGQMIDVPESERRGWAWTLERARADGHREAIDELESLAPYAADGRSLPPDALMKQRRWLNHYGGMVYGRRGGEHEAAAARLSPEYSQRELDLIGPGSAFSIDALLPEVLALDLGAVDVIDCPVVLMLGRHDVNVSSSVAADWFARLQAPFKSLVWFEHSAHEVMNEQPGQTLITLVQVVRPLAARGTPGRAEAGETRD